MEADFDQIGKDWMVAGGCEKIAQRLIVERKSLDSLKAARIRYLFKRKGPTAPKLVMGKCQRPSGLLRYYSDADFIIWFAANNCHRLALTYWQMEALIFHELKHAKVEDMVPVSVPHDWEGFAEEIKYYGLWQRDLKPIADEIGRNLHLPFDYPPEQAGAESSSTVH